MEEVFQFFLYIFLAVPVIRSEWLNVPGFEVRTAGLVRVRLNQVYRSTNENEEVRRENV